jgi:hypothetical protein
VPHPNIFECDVYFVISDTGLITGTWTGYKNSWSFGPLSASVDAYMATLAAIQWSPLQLGGGIQLYGNVQLGAFGIHVGLTADALLEGCAPSPFWIHGELSVELDLPWPLPNIGATISLTWGGDDGTVPPAPLALSHLDATLLDHCDAAGKPASDHYVLLDHAAPAILPDLSVTYDPVTPGILGLTAATGRTLTSPPDLVPNDSSSAQLAPVLPQDAHFTAEGGVTAGRRADRSAYLHPMVLAPGWRNHGLLRLRRQRRIRRDVCQRALYRVFRQRRSVVAFPLRRPQQPAYTANARRHSCAVDPAAERSGRRADRAAAARLYSAEPGFPAAVAGRRPAAAMAGAPRGAGDPTTCVRRGDAGLPGGIAKAAA